MLEKTFYKTIFKHSFGKTFKVVFWDGSEETYGDGTPEFTLRINEVVPVKDILADPSITLAEAYMSKKIDLESDNEFVIEDLIVTAFENATYFLENNKFGSFLPKKITHNKKESKEYIGAHYDIGNDFYELWLDSTMTYSGAYFKNDDVTLEQSQKDKVHHILSKLSLQPGERFLDIGCGWGTLIFTAAKEFNVKATGITLSEEQYRFVKDKIEAEGLQDQVSVELMDYRDLPDESFDRISSIGMVEHVGKENLPIYYKTINRLLKPKGVALVQGISGQRGGGANSWIEKYIFPGGYMPGVSETVQFITESSLDLIDLESLRRHYQKTLEHWTRNFHAQLPTIRETKDEEFIRMWDAYLQSCAGAFKVGHIDLVQYLMTKGANNDLPLTREYMSN